MHEKYTTRGCIIHASAYREADKIISIYTEDFGLVSVVAAGVRRSPSKLRYHIQDFSVRRFSLVRGRDIWRLVGAEEIAGIINLDPAASLEALSVYARVLSLIRRLVRGEEKNEQVFLTLFSLHNLLSTPNVISVENTQVKENTNVNMAALETLAVFRILHSLGYIKSDVATEPLITPPEISSNLVTSAKPLVSSLISAINAGLTESHL
jgi:recombinational DNA repair protein (RecF pathway)